MEQRVEDSNSPRFTYRIQFLIPMGDYTETSQAFIHADYYEYDKDCVSFFVWDEESGGGIIMSSIKGWFCIESKDFVKENQEDAIEELTEIFTRLSDALKARTCPSENEGKED